jgi:hypothetical protein
MTACSGVRSSSPCGPVSFGLLDGLRVRLRRPAVSNRFVTAFMEEAGLAFPRLYERISWSERRARRYDPVERGW